MIFRSTSNQKLADTFVVGILSVFLFGISVCGAFADTVRTLKVYNVHTGEVSEITFKKNNKYVQQGLNQLNHFLRDWRRDETIEMDPKLFDLLWEVYVESHSNSYIHVISGYRTKTTNDALRNSSVGVARVSQHTAGKAIDFYLPDVELPTLRTIAMRKQNGGVGYYPSSVSPFAHLDTGRVRHWPRMTRKQLVSLFPDGNTIHLPNDGVPLTEINSAQSAANGLKRPQLASIGTGSKHDSRISVPIAPYPLKKPELMIPIPKLPPGLVFASANLIPRDKPTTEDLEIGELIEISMAHFNVGDLLNQLYKVEELDRMAQVPKVKPTNLFSGRLENEKLPTTPRNYPDPAVLAFNSSQTDSSSLDDLNLVFGQSRRDQTGRLKINFNQEEDLNSRKFNALQQTWLETNYWITEQQKSNSRTITTGENHIAISPIESSVDENQKNSVLGLWKKFLILVRSKSADENQIALDLSYL